MDSVTEGKAAVLASKTKPPVPVVDASGIPEDLKRHKRWLGWKWSWKCDKWGKPPCNARSCKQADGTNPANWCSFEEAYAAYQAGRVDGIGFALGEGEGVHFAGVDLDDCRNLAGELSPLAKEVVGDLNTYAEVSPTGTGVKLLCLAALPPGSATKNKAKTVEIYSSGRYFCVTGQRLSESPPRVESRQAELTDLHQRHIGSEQRKSSPKPKKPADATTVDAKDVDADALQAMQRHRVSKKEVDGSKRLYCVACRAVEHDLSDAAAIATIRAYEREIPFPVSRTDAEILERIRSAEKKTDRGKALRIIDATEENLAVITPRAWKALEIANRPPTLFRYGGTASRIEKGDRGEPIISKLNRYRLRHHLARAATWVFMTMKGEEEIAPPMEVVDDVLATPDQPLPVLTRIVEAPVFASDGTLQTTPGYHPASQTYYVPADGFAVPPIAERPTTEEIALARAIIDELICDFPFLSQAERAHAIALLHLPFARDLIDGPTPLHLFEKPSPGTGATLLVDLLAYPAIGRPIPAMTEGRDEDEWRKRVTASLRSGSSYLFIDNLRHKLDSAAVAAGLTAKIWEDRVLGVSDVVRLPVRCCWIATGNNPGVSTEIARRTVRIRMDAKMDRPWQRTEFRHPHVREWAAEHRGELVWAALTLIQAWLAAGRPRGERSLGMFERWSEVMGGILTVAGIPSFLTNLSEFYDQSDAEGASWRDFVAKWWDRHKSSPVPVKTLWDIVSNEACLELGDGTDQSQKVVLGHMLSERRDRVFNLDDEPFKVRLTRGSKYQGAYNWQLSLAV